MAEEMKNNIDHLIQKGEEILDAEEANCIYGGRTICSTPVDHLNALYKSWRKEFDGVVEELKVNGIVITPEFSAESEQKILFFAKEQGYHKIKEYWQQHIKELKGILISLNIN